MMSIRERERKVQKNSNATVANAKDISYHLFKEIRKQSKAKQSQTKLTKAKQKPLALFSFMHNVSCLCVCALHAYGTKYKHIKLNWQYFPYLSLLISSCRLHASPSTRKKRNTSATILCCSLHTTLQSMCMLNVYFVLENIKPLQ